MAASKQDDDGLSQRRELDFMSARGSIEGIVSDNWSGSHVYRRTTVRVEKTLFHHGLNFMLGVVNLMIIPATYTMNPRMTVNIVTMPIGAE